MGPGAGAGPVLANLRVTPAPGEGDAAWGTGTSGPRPPPPRRLRSAGKARPPPRAQRLEFGLEVSPPGLELDSTGVQNKPPQDVPRWAASYSERMPTEIPGTRKKRPLPCSAVYRMHTPRLACARVATRNGLSDVGQVPRLTTERVLSLRSQRAPPPPELRVSMTSIPLPSLTLPSCGIPTKVCS